MASATGRHAAGRGDPGHHGGGRRRGALQHQHGVLGGVAIAAARRTAPRCARAPAPGRSRGRRTFRLPRELQPGILAGQAGQHGPRAGHRDAPGPARQGGVRADPHRPEPAHADLGEAHAGRDAARVRRPGVDQPLAAVAPPHPDAQRLGVGRHRLQQPPAGGVDADAAAHDAAIRARMPAVRSATRAQASSPASPCTSTVHSGWPAATGRPAGSRSAAQSGQTKPCGTTVARGV